MSQFSRAEREGRGARERISHRSGRRAGALRPRKRNAFAGSGAAATPALLALLRLWPLSLCLKVRHCFSPFFDAGPTALFTGGLKPHSLPTAQVLVLLQSRTAGRVPLVPHPLLPVPRRGMVFGSRTTPVWMWLAHTYTRGARGAACCPHMLTTDACSRGRRRQTGKHHHPASGRERAAAVAAVSGEPPRPRFRSASHLGASEGRGEGVSRGTEGRHW